MDWERLKQQLEQILPGSVRQITIAVDEWNALAAAQNKPSSSRRSVVREDDVLFLLEHHSKQQAAVLAVERGGVTEAERKLVELALDANRTQEKRHGGAMAEEERRAALVKEWFYRQLESGVTHAELPDALAAQLGWYGTKIPLLLYGDYSDSRVVQYHDFKKLLESFFDAEITLVPLMDKEWLILGPESILMATAGGDKEATEEESIEESLTSICFGLYEMLESEWVGECHLSIHYPMTPAKSLLATILQLRETMMLGRTFHIEDNIHLPWMLKLEKLLSGLPEADKTRFAQQVFKRVDHVFDAEMLATLEQFFALDCSVSETAKKLYIHRNTLLYRLDKFKQETGLDVRLFSDAVLVKVALLLYKVTKRK
ncbi:PucR family transcriptional regulator [Paenibacillus cymbidii]|uniref:PucR family transcriptional regulator n=1 Tax=Paenibacillus cymbidii TaxID=1639034 RepID=UPI0010817CE4|nr:helix-turn-helix domain-containing protein [Paenibacillus cymbidii]